MSYQVIARKYRPQTFGDVIGQDHVTRTLANALETGRIHHAYLFTGARGIGKTTVARLLAKALNCEKGPTNEPCNACSACNEITNGSSLDVQEIDGASNTGVDDVREIRDRVRYMPTSGRYKIYIIDEVHMLSTSAFNALLKTLEEPPAHVVFIFATTESHKIPATILSRCQRYDFRRIPPPKIAQSLKDIATTEKINVDDTALAMIAREAQGSMRDGQSLLDQAIAFAGNNVTAQTLEQMLGFLDRKAIFDLISAIMNRDSAACLSQLDEIYQTGTELTQLATQLLEMLRHLMVVKIAGSAGSATDLSPQETGQLTEYGKLVSAEELERMFGIWYAGTEQIARSPFPKMLTEIYLIRLCAVTPVTSVAEVIARIDQLVGSTGNTPPLCKGRSGGVEAPRTTGTPTPTPTQASTSPNSNYPPHPTLSRQGRGKEENIITPSLQRRGDASEWESFMRWLVGERPQVASIFNHGRLLSFANNTAELEFDARLYADMIGEADRKKQIDELLQGFFKRPITLKVSNTNADTSSPTQAAKRQKATKEALESNIVKKAAEIFDAKIHDCLLYTSDAADE